MSLSSISIPVSKLLALFFKDVFNNKTSEWKARISAYKKVPYFEKSQCFLNINYKLMLTYYNFLLFYGRFLLLHHVLTVCSIKANLLFLLTTFLLMSCFFFSFLVSRGLRAQTTSLCPLEPAAQSTCHSVYCNLREYGQWVIPHEMIAEMVKIYVWA